MPLARRSRRTELNIWPAFVDALGQLVIAIIFLLLIFTVAQFLTTDALSGRDQALQQLTAQVDQLTKLLNLERQSTSDLRLNVSQLSTELQNANAAKDSLTTRLAELAARAQDEAARADRLSRDLADASQTVSADKEKVDLQLRQLESLRRDIEALQKVRSDLETQVAALAGAQKQAQQDLAASGDKAKSLEARNAELAAANQKGQQDLAASGDKAKSLEARNAELAAANQKAQQDLAASGDKAKSLEVLVATLTAANQKLQQDLAAALASGKTLQSKVDDLNASGQKAQQDLTVLRDRSKELEARLMTAEERTALAQKEIDKRDIRLNELTVQGQKSDEQLKAEHKLSQDAQQRVDALNQQITALRETLQKLSQALDLSETKSKEQQVQIVDLGRRLNLALASKVEELARFRSEFFGRLREVLGERPDIRIVGDRFVFQSEVLFSPASADLGDDARRQLQPLAAAVKELVPKIPDDLNWVLRVDGHTDKRPINTSQFPSNWELSTARAISVVKYLVEQGVPASRLTAAGFGEFQPLDARDDEVAYRRNRRIELKLTDR